MSCGAVGPYAPHPNTGSVLCLPFSGGPGCETLFGFGN
jgi:hypothetical protein